VDGSVLDPDAHPSGVEHIDPNAHRVVGELIGKETVGPNVILEGTRTIAFCHERVWVAGGELDVIDPATHAVETIPLEGRGYAATCGHGSLWLGILSFAVERYDASGTVTRRIDLEGAAPIAMVSSDAAVWVADFQDRVHRIDGATNEHKLVPLEFGGTKFSPRGVAAEGERVWVIGYTSSLVGSHLLGLDDSSGDVTSAVPIDVDANLTFVDAVLVEAQGFLWTHGHGGVLKVNPDTGAVHVVEAGGDISDVKVGFGSVWATDTSASTTLMIDPATDEITETIPVGSNPTSLAISE